MDFALLGAGHETLPLIESLARNPAHRLVACVIEASMVPQVLQAAPACRCVTTPEELLNVAGINALILDSSAAAALDVALKLAANSVAILLIPQVQQGIEFVYQLGLIRDEQPDQFRLYPVRPRRLHPLAVRLKQLLQSGELGQIHQLQCQREIPVTAPPSQPCLLSPGQIENALLQDADLLKFWAGEFDQITALRTGDSEHGIIQASVSLAGAQAIPCHWVCRGTSGPATWQLAVVGQQGQVVLSGGDNASRIIWTQTLQGTRAPDELVQFDWGDAVIQEFCSALTIPNDQFNIWANDLCRSFELLEGSQRSLRRRRTVDLYFDSPSERANFKSAMTAVGCSLLMLTIVTILMGLGIGALAKDLNLPPLVMQIVRVLVFAPLFIFLILQIGVFLAKPTGGAKPAEPRKKDH